MPIVRIPDEKVIKPRKPEARKRSKEQSGDASLSLPSLQQTIGNRAVQRLIVQRSGEGSFDLDDETAGRINRQRGGGQALDSAVQAKMGSATGYDFSGVRVHTGPEPHALNQQLSAKAFTTGQDIFFQDGAYDPGSSGGQELLAHELTHVVQQGTGQVSGAGRMSVNAPGDAFEQQADAVAKTVTSPGTTASVQRQTDEEEEQVQRQEDDEEEKVQMQEDEDEENVK